MTKISWTDETWNPVVGCTKVSAGCQNCYAEKMAYRLKMMGQSKYFSVVDTFRGEHLWTNKIYCDESALDKPLHWRKPRRIFVCSMGDLFHPAVPFEFVDKVMFAIYRSYKLGHTFQILTKRPERMLKYFSGDVDMRILNLFRTSNSEKYTSETRLTDSIGTLSRVWLGVSVENQKAADERIPILLQIPAAVRFVSVEPMLEAINLLDLNGIMAMGGIYGAYLDWVIIGCESGPKRRECKIEWVRDLTNQCKAANVPVFVKQLSLRGCRKCRFLPCTHLHGHKQINIVSHKPEEWPEDLQVQEWPC